MSETKWVKAYKGFNSDMTCRGFQFEEGKEYETDKAELRKNGFHACLDPVDCFGYYTPNASEYHEVEIEDNGERNSNDTKVVGKKIKIGAKLSVAKICELHFNYVKEHCTTCPDNSTGDCSAASNTGNFSAASNTGDCSAASNTGDCSAASNTGDCSAASNTGNFSAASNTGNFSAASNTGDYSAASNTGYRSAASNTGDCSAASNTGDYSAASVSGEHSVAIAVGYCSRAKANIGSAIVIAERDDTGKLFNIKSAIVDGKKIKADTWYTVKNNRLVLWKEKYGE